MVNFYYCRSKGGKAILIMMMCCLLGQVLRAQTLGTNIIVNGDAETVPVAGSDWVDGGAGMTSFGDAGGTDGGPWYLTNTCSYPSAGSPMRASSGSQFFNAGINYAAGDARTLTQNITVPAFAGQDITYTFDGYVASNGLSGTQFNLVQVTVEYRDATETSIYTFTYSLVPTTAGPTGWVHISNTQQVLATDMVTHVIVTLTAEHDNTSNTIEAYFDNLSLVPTLTTLPVTLVDFHALQQPDHTVALQWETVQEQNSKYAEVQRSADGKTYLPIGQVAAAGNSSLPRGYTFIDKAPLTGRSFYRLKMVDMDGSFRYSKILQLATGAGGTAIKVYSNPFHDQLGVQIPATAPEKLVLSLLDQTGKACLHQNYTTQKGDNFINLYPAGLASGVYLLHIQGAQTERTIRVLKE